MLTDDTSLPELTLDRLPVTITLTRDTFRGSCLVVMLDQTKLPYEEVTLRLSDWREVVDAIKKLQVRGAPALGIAGAAALTLCTDEFVHGNHNSPGENRPDPSVMLSTLEQAAEVISHARPTAVNLSWGVQCALRVAREHLRAGDEPSVVVDALCDLVADLGKRDIAQNHAIGRNGAALLKEGTRVLTHCNAGSLATVAFGTALGIVYTAAEEGKIAHVYADETRPLNQGARLTTWEVARVGIPVTLICDDMAASVMAAGNVDAVIVGADRIAANGDTANKIGTYGLAILAAYHHIDFYVAAPTSSIDFSVATGEDIPIEQRSADEVLPRPIAGVGVFNPAFDITPAHLITKIITERGVFSPDELAAAYDSEQG